MCVVLALVHELIGCSCVNAINLAISAQYSNSCAFQNLSHFGWFGIEFELLNLGPEPSGAVIRNRWHKRRVPSLSEINDHQLNSSVPS